MRRYTLYNRIFPRLMAVLLVLTLSLSMAPAVSAQETGSCGDNLTWELRGDTLVISGSGGMWDFPENAMAPWYEYRASIAAVELPQGLTRIGALAFYGCSALTSVVIPNSVTAIGRHAFDGCTGLTMLTLSSKLTSLGDSAFRECTALRAVHLPETLTTLGNMVFYRCESLSTITIPASVTEMGLSMFSFCNRLVRAEIWANITVLPSWTFYGCPKLADVILAATLESADPGAFGKCTGLDHVEYSGEEEHEKQLNKDLDRDQEGKGFADVSDDPVGDSSGNTTYDESGETIVEENTTVIQTENTTVVTETTTEQGNADPTETKVDVTVENETGWSEAGEILEETLENTGSAQVDIYVKDDSQVPPEVLDSMAGKDITLTVHAASGTVWQIDCSTLVAGDQTQGHGFLCQRLDATAEELELLGCAAAYQIRFLYAARINAEVMLRLPAAHARATATLCQMVDGELSRLQSVVVDDNGFAHFYLGSVDPEILLYVAINLPDLAPEEVIIPENLYPDYGVTQRTAGVEYVITGRKSSWNMDIGQVTWILAAVMLGSIVIVGAIMFAWNKSRLNRGYVSDWQDDEE